MTKHTIELETDGKYCGECGHAPAGENLLTGYCEIFYNDIKSFNGDNYIRCQACLDSEVKNKKDN